MNNGYHDCEKIANKGAPVGFEGPEKRLEIDFVEDVSRPTGLRVLNKSQWQELCTMAKCTIIGHTSNAHFDSFVLSESSLFVYPFKIMIKTCGTTTLLNIIPKVLEYATSMNLSLRMVMFSRKNFLFPQAQLHPHSAWEEEVNYLNQFFEGTSYVFGPATGDHWHLYLASNCCASSSSCIADGKTIVHSRSMNEGDLVVTSEDHLECSQQSEKEEFTLEIMMHDLDREMASKFYRKEGTRDTDKFPGMADILPGASTDEFNFTPCGYSMNGLRRESYYTIHVTPEAHCSYASFETNVSLTSYRSLISDVLNIFKPGRMTLTFFVERNSRVEGDHESSFPLDIDDIRGFRLQHKSHANVEGGNEIFMCNYCSVQAVSKDLLLPEMISSSSDCSVSKKTSRKNKRRAHTTSLTTTKLPSLEIIPSVPAPIPFGGREKSGTTKSRHRPVGMVDAIKHAEKSALSSAGLVQPIAVN